MKGQTIKTRKSNGLHSDGITLAAWRFATLPVQIITALFSSFTFSVSRMKHLISLEVHTFKTRPLTCETNFRKSSTWMQLLNIDTCAFNRITKQTTEFNKIKLYSCILVNCKQINSRQVPLGLSFLSRNFLTFLGILNLFARKKNYQHAVKRIQMDHRKVDFQV